ncbi:MAG: ankyrin repeat domain-containing protein [Candidatus Electrothrix sp. AU1_5]|nr:ankyrin repeat domain-containing protein [Candidatus Electrothrix gigas]
MLDEAIKAVYSNDLNLLRIITKEGRNINHLDDDGRTILMHAILSEKNDLDIVKFILDCGADVNLHDGEQRWTALHFASRDQQKEIVQLLLESGADPNTVECFGNTPLSRALNKVPINFEIIKLLLDYGANPTVKNNYGNSPLDTANLIGNKELIDIFIKYL